MQTLSAVQARRISLAAQGFGAKRGTSAPTWRKVRSTIDRLGLFQMDSINIVVRAHYMPAYSRVGAYNPARFDDKAFHPRRRELFEYWGHEASLMPLALQPLLRWRMARARRFDGIWGSIARIGREQPDYVEQVRRQIAERGPSSAREFEVRGRSGGSMWDWHDAKTALEFLFAAGALTTHSRRGFERVYDLTERVLPADILDRPTPSETDAQRALVAIAARALGIATRADLRDYFRLGAADGTRAVDALVESGEVEPVAVEGWAQTAYLARDAIVPRKIRAAALVSPFDPLVWERKRTERMFGFRYRIEIYTPSHKRSHGYYVLPFLLDEALSARVDLKADRTDKVLRVLSVHGEDGIDRGHVAEALAAELRHLAEWLGLSSVLIGNRGDLAADLKRSCGN
jgi:hypothetical protein